MCLLAEVGFDNQALQKLLATCIFSYTVGTQHALGTLARLAYVLLQVTQHLWLTQWNVNLISRTTNIRISHLCAYHPK